LIFRRLAVPLLVLALPLSACGRETQSAAAAAVRVDDLGDTIPTGLVAQRIVSLSPVTTELLFALGAGSRVVGRTHWDSYPAEARAVADLGNGMQPNVEAVLGAHPDLVVLYASNANRAAVQRIRQAGIATISLHQDRVEEFRRAAIALGIAIGDSARGAALADSVTAEIRAVAAVPVVGKRPRVFWHVWDVPVITIGKASYLDELVTAAGADNLFADMSAASPQVSLEEVVKRDPDFVLAGPNSAPKVMADPAWRAVRAVREGRVLVVDTALVGRPGIRMGEATRRIRALLDSAMTAKR
jgi:iron complex transport system substrate-binding protein